MTAIFKRELRSYFRGMTGYVFIALFLAVLGIYVSAICLNYHSPKFEYIYFNTTFIFLIAVPVLSMRSIAEERRQKTDQLLYSLPISTAEIVLGKYFAMLGVFAIPVLVSCLFPLILLPFDPSGLLSLATIYSSALAYFLLGAALISIGLFMSSLTENQIIAALVSFVAMLICYLMGQLKDMLPSTAAATAIVFAFLSALLSLLVFFVTKSRTAGWLIFIVLEAPIIVISFAKTTLLEGLLPKVFGVLSVFDRFYTFADGLFDGTSIIYFLSVAALFVVFTVQSMEKRRWS